MKLTLQLRFHTEPGQSLFVTGNHDLLGNGQVEKAFPLSYLDPQFWHGSLAFGAGQAPDADITYHYILRNADGSVVHDWGEDRTFKPASFEAQAVLIIDSWNDPSYIENAFYTEPFQRVLLKENHTEVKGATPTEARGSDRALGRLAYARGSDLVTHTFRAKAPLLAKGQTLCLVGDCPALRNWNTAAPILLKRSADDPFLSVRLDLRGALFPIAYKYGVYDVENGKFVRYEDGPNRILRDRVAPGKQTIINDGFVALPANTWKGAGIAIPVFSLRSENSFGVGEFTDLKLLADWCAQTGLKLIQILPVNDTTATHSWKDSYPYSAISAFALHPIYLNLKRMLETSGGECQVSGEGRVEKGAGTASSSRLCPEVDKCGDEPSPPLDSRLPESALVSGAEESPHERLNEPETHRGSKEVFKAQDSGFKVQGSLLNRLQALNPERQRLNSLADLDYEPVMKAKMGFIRDAYPLLKNLTFESPDYRQFFDQNQHWLVPYAVFCYLRDQHGTADFNQWPTPRRLRKEEMRALASDGTEAYAEIGLTYFIQYHLHTQLREASQYAHSKDVILKGDIPIGVYPHGSDVWQEPELYHTDMKAGAPPDPFSAKGQNWEFPTYNWPRMEQDGFAWWKQRFAQMSTYFDAFRIDHILGFFRIWSIPASAVEGILGYFVPAIPIHVGEFKQRGIWFDRNRYVQPHITDRVLWDIFGPDQETLKARFLNRQPSGKYSLKPEFATQRQVEAHFAKVEERGSPSRSSYERADTQGSSPSESNQTRQSQKLKLGLYELISNVLLFEVEGSQGQQFHFRLGIEDTSSFKELDGQTQARLKELYIDYFYRRQDDFWRRQALRKLPALKRVTNMLICGEDLGMVPACVPGVMKQLGLLTLEVQRMPKVLNQQFSRPKDAPYLSVVTPSTHDMSTIRGWWEEDRGLTQRFYNQEMDRPGEAPRHCEPWVSEAIVAQHLASPAMWSIFQLQDLLGMNGSLRRENSAEERINIPADPKHYWRYRLHLTLESLIQADSFNQKLNSMLRQSGRV